MLQDIRDYRSLANDAIILTSFIHSIDYISLIPDYTFVYEHGYYVTLIYNQIEDTIDTLSIKEGTKYIFEAISIDYDYSLKSYTLSLSFLYTTIKKHKYKKRYTNFNPLHNLYAQGKDILLELFSIHKLHPNVCILYVLSKLHTCKQLIYDPNIFGTSKIFTLYNNPMDVLIALETKQPVYFIYPKDHIIKNIQENRILSIYFGIAEDGYYITIQREKPPIYVRLGTLFSILSTLLSKGFYMCSSYTASHKALASLYKEYKI